MSTDIKNQSESTKKEVRFVDGKLKVVELDKKGKIIRVIKDYTGPSPTKKKYRTYVDTYDELEKVRKADIVPISTISPAKYEVRFVNGKLRVVEIGEMSKVVRVVRDYPTKPILPIEDEKPPMGQITEPVPEPFIQKAQRIIEKPTPEAIIEEKVEELPHLDIQELLDSDKFYDENTRLLYCPKCYRYDVKFVSGHNVWSCNWCNKQIYYNDFKFSDRNKYQIYKLWGIGALKDVVHMESDAAKQFVASYFKKCCETKKDKCLYFGIFEEEHITDEFEIAKMSCNFLRENIEQNSVVIETIKSLLYEDMQRQIDEEYAFVIQVAGLMTTQLDDYLIATANVDLEKDQVAYVIVDNDNITVDLNPVEGMECIECFTWNGTNKGGVVGVSSLPSNSLNELRQMFKVFIERMNRYINTGTLKDTSKMEDRIKSLSSSEKKVLSFIHSSENGCLQIQLWKKLDIDREKCLATIESLKDLIIKEPTNYRGTYTYRLRTIELGILSLELEINSEQMATKKKILKEKMATKKKILKEKMATKKKILKEKMITKKKILKEPIMHFKNPNRENRTMCGHDCTIPERTYSNVTIYINNVTCKLCTNNINNAKKKIVKENEKEM